MNKEIIKRYLIRINKYITVSGSSILIGSEEVETDSGTRCLMPESKYFSSESKINITIEFIEEREYKKSRNIPGMIELINQEIPVK